MDVATASSMPNVHSLHRTHRCVWTNKNRPSQPKTLSELVIIGDLQRNNDEKFWLSDSGPAEQRMLIFATQRNLEFLKHADVWLMDGTFEYCTTDVQPIIYNSK